MRSHHGGPASLVQPDSRNGGGWHEYQELAPKRYLATWKNVTTLGSALFFGTHVHRPSPRRCNPPTVLRESASGSPWSGCGGSGGASPWNLSLSVSRIEHALLTRALSHQGCWIFLELEFPFPQRFTDHVHSVTKKQAVLSGGKLPSVGLPRSSERLHSLFHCC
jgi:hypothetical protein